MVGMTIDKEKDLAFLLQRGSVKHPKGGGHADD